jgi:P27 family predicted phage terminase small subunit
MRVLTEADGEALALAADALADYVTARGVIQKKGHTYETKTEAGAVMVRPRPEVSIASDAWKRARLMLLEFGLTPAARGKVKAVPVRTPNHWEKFAQ